jgi:hypothetical protein
MVEVPFKVYEVDWTDGTPDPRQLNCALLEFPDGAPDNKWEPTTDSLGGKDVLYIFGSNYDANPNVFYTSKNLFLNQATTDIMYIWSARRLDASAPLFNINDQMFIYPYTTTRPEIAAGYPLFYQVDVKQPDLGSTSIATSNNDLDKIRVVPNPYYGFNTLETPTSGRFITFRHLPKECTVKIYTLNGDLIRTLSKNDNSSTLQWHLNNMEDIPIASGMYIALLDAPGIGQKVFKLAVMTPEERIDF